MTATPTTTRCLCPCGGRFSRGMSYGVSYTWSHNIADYVDNLTGTAFPQDSYDYAAERGDSMFDVRQRFVGFLTYELPVGKRQEILESGRSRERRPGRMASQHDRDEANRCDHRPLPVPTAAFPEVCTPLGPDCLGDGRAGASDDPRTGLWLNPAAFATPADGQVRQLSGREAITVRV